MFDNVNFLFAKIPNETNHKSLVNICNEMFPIIREAAKNNNSFENAMEFLLDLEKVTRNADHLESNIRVVTEIVNLCVETNHWKELSTYITTVSNRRLIMKKSIAAMIKHCLMLIESSNIWEDTHLDLLKVLREIVESKNYLEIERAKLSKMMAEYYEQENNIDAAIKILEDLKCEQITNMDNRQKIKIQLQLIRLLIVKENYIKAQILSNKISKKFLEESDQVDLKLNYYNLKITLDCKENFLQTSKHYQSILNCYNDDDPIKLKIIGAAVLYCILAPYDNEQNHCMKKILGSNILKALPTFKELLNIFMSKEIINIDSFLEKFKNYMSKYEILNEETEIGKRNWLEIHSRLLEHNIMVIASYYTQIYLARMSEILGITAEKCENLLSELSLNCRIAVKIDRLTGIVNFKNDKHINEKLNDRIFYINELTKKVNIVFHEVNKI